MKKVILAALAIITVLASVGCAGSKASSATPEYSKLEVNLNLAEGEMDTLCFTTSSQGVYSIGSRNGNATGPLVDTDRLVIYDFDNEKIAGEFSLKTEAYIYNAVPYKDGLLYSTYEGKDGSCRWKVNYIDSRGEKTIDSGICQSSDFMPEITIVDETPYYLYEDSSKEYLFGVKSVSGTKAETVVEPQKGKLWSMALTSNGKQYSFVIVDENEKLSCVIGDKGGITGSTELKGQLNDFDINDRYVICSLGKDEKNSKLIAVSIENGETVSYDSDRQLFRVKGSGENFVCVDGEFKTFSVDVDGDEISRTEIDVPEDVKGSEMTVAFFAMGNGKYLVQFEKDKILSYIMTM